MLKLTYTETATYLEHLAQTPEDFVSLRVTLAMRMGQTILAEPSSAAFLLPRNLPVLSLLEDAIQLAEAEMIALCIADEDTMEVSLGGTWVTFDPDQENGIFVTRLSDRTEYLLTKLWNQAYSSASVIGGSGD
ncbi:MAG: alr0857 family protein [Microcoleaceae cyanobacterium]